MSDLPEYDGMKRRGARYEVRVSVPPDVAAALHEEAVRRDVGPGVVARGWIREYRAGVTAGRGVTMDMVRVALDEVGVDTVRLAAWKAAGEALSPLTARQRAGYVYPSHTGTRLEQVIRSTALLDGEVFDLINPLTIRVRASKGPTPLAATVEALWRHIDDERSVGEDVELWIDGVRHLRPDSALPQPTGRRS